ncbi:hypothetical protein BC826DRAFT_721571 [Russula brevipes]|nr:hypothetical protein BC826DRAFT_721571 [Russula brevipes]
MSLFGGMGRNVTHHLTVPDRQHSLASLPHLQYRQGQTNPFRCPLFFSPAAQVPFAVRPRVGHPSPNYRFGRCPMARMCLFICSRNYIQRFRRRIHRQVTGGLTDLTDKEHTSKGGIIGGAVHEDDSHDRCLGSTINTLTTLSHVTQSARLQQLIPH